MIAEQLKGVFYCDGSCKGNPGYAGSGVFGYTFKDSKRPKNIKHPSKAKVRFTNVGISQEDSPSEPIEVVNIVDCIVAINDPKSTNNEAELTAVITALRMAVDTLKLKSIKIITDSNYIVSSFNENLDRWIKSDWRRLDGKEIVHRRNWEEILFYRNKCKEEDVHLELEWVKGHAGDYGNEMADIYSLVGSNSSRRQIETGVEFNRDVLTSVQTYAEYKELTNHKDFVYHFKELYFSSDKDVDDLNYCFLNIAHDQSQTGKRDLSSIFVTNVGFVPPLLNKFKAKFRETLKPFTTTGCMAIGKLADKDMMRLANLIDVSDLLVKHEDSNTIHYKLPGDNGLFMTDSLLDYPFMVAASSIYMNTLDIAMSKGTDISIQKDISDLFVKEGKIAFSNKVKNIDLGELYSKEFVFISKPLLTIGKDTPNYLTLKAIESDIQKVTVIANHKQDTNRCSVYLRITTADRDIYSINIEDKYFVKAILS